MGAFTGSSLYEEVARGLELCVRSDEMMERTGYSCQKVGQLCFKKEATEWRTLVITKAPTILTIYRIILYIPSNITKYLRHGPVYGCSASINDKYVVSKLGYYKLAF